MLLVMGKDVDGKVLAEGFESSFIGGGSDEKPAKKKEHTECAKMAVVRV